MSDLAIVQTSTEQQIIDRSDALAWAYSSRPVASVRERFSLIPVFTPHEKEGPE